MNYNARSSLNHGSRYECEEVIDDQLAQVEDFCVLVFAGDHVPVNLVG